MNSTNVACFPKLRDHVDAFACNVRDATQDITQIFYKTFFGGPGEIKGTANVFKTVCLGGTYVYNNYFKERDNIFVIADKKFSPLKKGANGIAFFFILNEWVQDPTAKGNPWKLAARVFNTVAGVSDMYQLGGYLGFIATKTTTIKVLGAVATVSAESVKNSCVIIASLLSLVDGGIAVVKLIQLCNKNEMGNKPHWSEFITPCLTIAFAVGKVAVIVFAGPEIYLAFVGLSVATSSFSVLRGVWKNYQDTTLALWKKQLILAEKELASRGKEKSVSTEDILPTSDVPTQTSHQNVKSRNFNVDTADFTQLTKRVTFCKSEVRRLDVRKNRLTMKPIPTS